jgi:electron transport complex protein RnfA
MTDILAIIVAALFSQNFILVKFLGICPFLGVSKKVDSALGMGLAVTAVMVLTCVVTYPLYTFVLVPLGLEYMEILVFILVIAALVQMLEMLLKKFSPGLYSAMGVYLPLVTTNCAILGIAESVIAKATSAESAGFILKGVFFGKWLNVPMQYSMGSAVLAGLFYGLGFTLAIVLLAGIRQKVDKLNIAKPLRGFPITMIVACFMAMAFYVFTLMA